MAKGMLKQRLEVTLAKEELKKSQQKKATAQKQAIKEDGPKVVTKEQLAAKEAEKAQKRAAKKAREDAKKAELAKEAEKPEEYESEVLSKKEQRKVKKAILSQVQDEEHNEDEEEQDEDESDDEEGSDVEIADETDSEMEEYLLDLEQLARSDSEDDDEEDEEEQEDEEEGSDEKEQDEEVEDEEEEEEDEEDIPLSDVELDSDADVVPHTKLTINNVAALKNALTRIELPWKKHSFQEHQSITAEDKVEPQIKDIYDDTERELAFYKQALQATTQGRSKLLNLKVRFTRPADYFAEMIKSDEHMDKLKQKLVKEATEKKASQDAKRQRELKKFGKQVQNQTLQDRQKDKRDTLEKIKTIKKKRQNDEMSNDQFEIALEEATADKAERADRDTRGRGFQPNKRAKPNTARIAKDAKYGQGGMKRFKRKNDAASSNDMTDFSQRKMKGKSAKRPGKSKRGRN